MIDPSRWYPRSEGIITSADRPQRGHKIAWRYATWKITEVFDPDDTGAYNVTLRHLTGPVLTTDGIISDDHGTYLGLTVHQHYQWHYLARRHTICSCHGHIWPCYEYDQDRHAAWETRQMERALAGAQSGVCASCREQITSRQKTITFPEPSLFVPGAPGPTFHAGRSECWRDARAYEVEKRLVAYPEATRIASCPGQGFVHEIGLTFECTAGPGCTGLHGAHRTGKRKAKVGTCATTVRMAGSIDHYERPLTDCGYRPPWGQCLGAETGPRRPLESGIRDLFGGGR